MTNTVVRPDIMPMAVEPTAIDGLLRITPKVVTDERGTVRSFSERAATAQPVSVPTAGGRSTSPGRSAARGSPTFGLVVAERLTPGVQVFVPAGVCNGFQAVSDPGASTCTASARNGRRGWPASRSTRSTASSALPGRSHRSRESRDGVGEGRRPPAALADL